MSKVQKEKMSLGKRIDAWQIKGKNQIKPKKRFKKKIMKS